MVKSAFQWTSLIYLTFFLIDISSFKLLPIDNHHKKPFTVLKLDLNSIKDTSKPIVFEVICKKAAVKTKAKSMSYSSTYKENKEDRVVNLLDSPVSRILGGLLNPVTMLLVLYFSSIGWSKVLWLQKVLKVFGKGSIVTKQDGSVESAAAAALKALPFQTFECEVSGRQSRLIGIII